MALPEPLPERYECKTPAWLLLGWFLIVPSVVGFLLLIASDLPSPWAAALVTFAALFLIGFLWLPIRLLIGGRVALVLDEEGLEDRTSWRVRRVSWSNVKTARFVRAIYSGGISVWLHEDPERTRPPKTGAGPRNDWSAEDFIVNQTWTMLEHHQANRLFEHYGGVRVTH